VITTQGSYMPKKGETPRGWHLVDAAGQPPGRIATQIAKVLMGKHRPQWTAHVDTGEFVVVINASKIKLTGRKLEQKRYYRFSGYPGNLRSKTAAQLMETKPDRVLYVAIRKMLPKTKLGRQMVTKLKVYAGPDHPHAAQMPQPLTF
jgi:large subunit ribosomal protein L13